MGWQPATSGQEKGERGQGNRSRGYTDNNDPRPVPPFEPAEPMTDSGRSNRSGWVRLVAFSLGAAVLAVAFSKLRRSKLLPQGDGGHEQGAPPPRTRSQRLRNPKPPAVRVERGSTSDSHSVSATDLEATPDQEAPDQTTEGLDHTEPDGAPPAFQPADARATQELDPYAWPDQPPAPPAAPGPPPDRSEPQTPSADGQRLTLNPADQEPLPPTLPLATRPAVNEPPATPASSLHVAGHSQDRPVGRVAASPEPPLAIDSGAEMDSGAEIASGAEMDSGAVVDSGAEMLPLLEAATTTVDFTDELESPTTSTERHGAGDSVGPTVADAAVRTITPPQQPPIQSRGPFYGWFLVAAVFIILCITSGVGFYNASVILSAATRELGASVGSVSGATGLFFAIGGLTGFVFSKRMESVDIRLFFVGGGLVGAAALLGLRWVTSVAGLYVFFGFFGIAFGLAGLVPATTLVTRWFDRRRSVALSIASTGLSVGGIVVTPFSDWLIEERTLSGAAPYLATIWLLGVIPIALIVVRSYPSDKGLRPDGDPAPTLSDGTDPVDASPETMAGPALASDRGSVVGLSFARARTTRFFMALCIAYAVIFFGQVGGIAQLFNMILERTDAPTARTALAVLAGSSVIFRLLGGAAVLRLPTKAFSAALAVVQAAALVLLAVSTSSTGLILSAAFFGCSIGNLLMLQPLLLAEAFGVANYGRIYSFNQLFGTIGVAGGPLALGLIHDASDYRAAFFAAAVASFVGCLAIIAAGSTSKVQSLWS